MIESGYQCSGDSPDICTPLCGDWKLVGSESCDDGNINDGDGCDSNCEVEIGMYCEGGSYQSRDRCYEICGDGRNIGHFTCDDGNVIDGDGCSSECLIEEGWQC